MIVLQKTLGYGRRVPACLSWEYTGGITAYLKHTWSLYRWTLITFASQSERFKFTVGGSLWLELVQKEGGISTTVP